MKEQRATSLQGVLGGNPTAACLDRRILFPLPSLDVKVDRLAPKPGLSRVLSALAQGNQEHYRDPPRRKRQSTTLLTRRDQTSTTCRSSSKSTRHVFWSPVSIVAVRRLTFAMTPNCVLPARSLKLTRSP